MTFFLIFMAVGAVILSLYAVKRHFELVFIVRASINLPIHTPIFGRPLQATGLKNLEFC